MGRLLWRVKSANINGKTSLFKDLLVVTIGKFVSNVAKQERSGSEGRENMQKKEKE